MLTHAYFNRLFWVLFALAAIILLIRLGSAPVYILDEAKNAQCAREMYLKGNWIVPTFNSELRTDKPPLHYWFMMISYAVFGVGEWQARLFSAFAGLGTILVSFFFVRRYLNATTAFFTALALVLSTHFLFEFRLAVPDPYLILFTALGLFAGFAYLEERSVGWLLLAAASLALATLAKGPVALGLPGISLLLHVILKRKWWVLLDWRLLAAATVYGVIAVPWYVAVHQQTAGAFTRGFFLEHNISRFSSEMEGHGGPFFLTMIIVFVGMLPFSIFVVNAVRRLWRPQLPPIVLLGAIVSFVYILFFSISSTKLPNYPMPCYPFLAIVLGFYLAECLTRRKSLPAFGWWFLAIFSLAIPVAGFFALKAEPTLQHLRLLPLGLAVLPVTILFSWRYFGQRVHRQLQGLSLGYVIFNLFFLAVAYPTVYLNNPVSAANPIINLQKNSVVVAYKDYNAAFNFNLSDSLLPIRVFTDSASLMQFCSNAANQNSGGIIVLSRTDKLSELNVAQFEEVLRRRDLFEIPTTIVLRFKKF